MELIFKKLNDNRLYVKYAGKINIENSEEINKKIKNNLEKITELVFDFSEVSYISSAGIRMLLDIKKTLLAQKGCLYIKNVNDEVQNVIEIAGLQSILNII